MQIVNLIKNPKGGKVKAFFAVEWLDKMIIRDCKLIENENGEMFAAMPSRQYEHKGEKKWSSIVQIFDQNLLDKITAAAKAEYNKGNADDSEIPF